MLHGNVVQAEQMAIAGGLNVGKKVRNLANTNRATWVGWDGGGRGVTQYAGK